MRQCVIYARVSSKEQEKEGYSIPAQIALLEEYAKRHELSISQQFTEAETAKSSGREQFGQMLKFVASKAAPKVILVEKTDRLYRNWRDYVAVEDLMNEHKIEIHLVKEGEVLSQQSNSHTKMIHGIKVLMAKNYIDNLSEETKKGMLQKAKEGGWVGPPPHGYKMIEGKLIIDPEKAVFTQAAFRIYAAGDCSLQYCSKTLKDRGFVFRSYQPKIPISNLERLLKNEVYIGKVKFNGQIFDGLHEPLITLDLWQDTQRAFKKDGKPMNYSKRTFRYSRIMKCGECGSLCVGEVKKGKYTYYRCATVANKKKSCNQGYINENLIDKQVQDLLGKLELPPTMYNQLLQAQEELNAIHIQSGIEEGKKLGKELDKYREKLNQAYKDKLGGVIDESLWLDISQEFKEKIFDIQAKIEQLSMADINYYETALRLFELPKRLNRGWLTANDEEKAILLNSICSNFFLKDGKAHLELKEPFNFILQNAVSKNWGPSWDALRTFIASNNLTISRAMETLAA